MLWLSVASGAELAYATGSLYWKPHNNLMRLNTSRVSTNLTEQISSRVQEGFQEKFRTCLHCFGLLCYVPILLHLVEHVIMSSNQRSSLCYST